MHNHCKLAYYKITKMISANHEFISKKCILAYK